MRKGQNPSRPVLVGALVALCLSAALAPEAAAQSTVPVDCDKGQSIQRHLDRTAASGDTIRVSGACAESIAIKTDGVTLDCIDRANASITGSGAAVSTVTVSASNVTVAHCSIYLGDSTDGALSVTRAGSADIVDNWLEGAAVTQSAYGRLIGNEITGAPASGVTVSGSGYADLAQNNIHDNAENGVFVANSSGADIVGNTITGHAGSAITAGILVLRVSVANFVDVVLGSTPNVITGNTRGIVCTSNSAVAFGRPTGVAQGTAGDNNVLDFLAVGNCSVGPTAGFNPFPPP